jgi:hypothetical protein
MGNAQFELQNQNYFLNIGMLGKKESNHFQY